MLFCSIHTKQYIGSLEEVVAFHTEIQFPLLFSAQFYQGERIKLNSIHSGMAGNGGTWIAL